MTRPPDVKRAARLGPATARRITFDDINNSARPTPAQSGRKRLPAHGRRLAPALAAGLRPRKAGGGIMVTSEWDWARAFDPGRVVCPSSERADEFEFGFLAGCEVIVLVPERNELHGEALAACVRAAGAALVVVAVLREAAS